MTACGKPMRTLCGFKLPFACDRPRGHGGKCNVDPRPPFSLDALVSPHMDSRGQWESFRTFVRLTSEVEVDMWVIWTRAMESAAKIDPSLARYVVAARPKSQKLDDLDRLGKAAAQ